MTPLPDICHGSLWGPIVSVLPTLPRCVSGLEQLTNSLCDTRRPDYSYQLADTTQGRADTSSLYLVRRATE